MNIQINHVLIISPVPLLLRFSMPIRPVQRREYRSTPLTVLPSSAQWRRITCWTLALVAVPTPGKPANTTEQGLIYGFVASLNLK